MQNKINIFIADSRSDFRDMIVSYIGSKSEFNLVGIADTGKEAIEGIINKKPDIILLDIMLPSYDGIWVLEEMQRIGLHKTIKSFVITSIDNDDVAQRAMLCGASYYMIKPFDMEILERRIKQMLGRTENDCPIHEVNEFQLGACLSDSALENRISEILSGMGVPASIKGYQYLKKAIFMTVNDENAVIGITKVLYPNIAQIFNTTASKVERAMRHAIESSWNKGGQAYYKGIIGGANCEKPTNGQFIANLAEYIRTNRFNIEI